MDLGRLVHQGSPQHLPKLGRGSTARRISRRKGLQLITCLLISFTSPVAAQESALLDSVSRYVLAELARQRIPGASVTILRGDSVLLSRGFGLANLELRVPASDSTIYQSGSIGKQFTASGILMLAEQGRLRLDDRITKWLPEGAGVWDSLRGTAPPHSHGRRG
jgi:CubicO group peptidase (beta-lactamase class C family)